MVISILSTLLVLWFIFGLISPKKALSFLIKDEDKRSRWKVLGIYVAFAFILYLISGVGGNKTESKSSNLVSNADKATVVDSTASVKTEVESPKPKSNLVGWKETEEIDEMTDTKNVWKTIRSLNGVMQDFPYNNGETYAKITVRYMKKYGNSVLITINQGQILCNPFSNNNYVTVRFDEQKPKKYSFNGAADGSTETVFLNNSADFIANAKKAKDIKIEFSLFQGGNPLFKFHVDEPLVWEH